jgi:choline dehydrogenase-like flavoprotein
LGEFAPYPYSRGHIHITGAKINDPLDFKTGYLTDPLDIKMHLWAYKKQREVARRMSVYRGEVALGHPPFPTNSKAAIVDIDGPLAKDVIDIEYSPEDDEIIEKWLRENIGTMWHSLGTCKIGELDDMGVVDSSLRVHGVKKLRIADLSILPQNIGANTSNMAFAVGEKAADLLIRDLRLGDGS